MDSQPIFTPDFIAGLPDDPIDCALAVASTYEAWRKVNPGKTNELCMHAIDAYACAESLAQGGWGGFGGISFSYVFSIVLAGIDQKFKQLTNWAATNQEMKLANEHYKASCEKYAQDPRNPFEYRFDTDQLNRLQQLINEVRDELQNLENIPDNWRRRMLRRLESLQKELHERMSSLDRFWGIVGEALPVLHQLGVAAKPIVNRLREMAEIGMRVHAVFYNLPIPPGVPILPPAEDDPELPIPSVSYSSKMIKDNSED